MIRLLPMAQYIFEPGDLQRVVRMHANTPLEERFDRITQTLHAVYGDHVHPDQAWIWSNAGGIMCSMRVLHVTPREYLLFCGTAVGSSGHSGRHRAELWDIVVHGELQTYRPNQCRPVTLRAGDCSHLPRGATNASSLGPECWLMEYARGNVPSMFPFALGDTVFSTQDLTDMRKMMACSAKLMLKEAKRAIERRLAGKPKPAPQLDLIRRSELEQIVHTNALLDSPQTRHHD